MAVCFSRGTRFWTTFEPHLDTICVPFLVGCLGPLLGSFFLPQFWFIFRYLFWVHFCMFLCCPFLISFSTMVWQPLPTFSTHVLPAFGHQRVVMCGPRCPKLSFLVLQTFIFVCPKPSFFCAPNLSFCVPTRQKLWCGPLEFLVVFGCFLAHFWSTKVCQKAENLCSSQVCKCLHQEQLFSLQGA